MATVWANSDKQNLLASLYSLRAGISLALIYKKNADRIIDDGKKKKTEHLAKWQNYINSKNTNSERAKSEKTRIANEIAQVNIDIRNNQYDIKSKKSDIVKNSFLLTSFIMLTIAILAFMAYWGLYFAVGAGAFGHNIEQGSILDVLYGWMYLWGDENALKSGSPGYKRTNLFGPLSVVIICLIIPCLIAVIIVSIIKIVKTIKKIHSDKESYGDCLDNIVRYNQRKRTLESQLTTANNSVLKTSAAAAEGSKEMANARNSAQAFINTATAKATPFVQTSLDIVNTLNSCFSSYIDKRDWVNLDFIIYCLETGRADNLKEALFAVDRQKQVNQIVSAIENAGKEIARSMNTTITRLEDKMVHCFNMISTQFERQTRQLNSINSQLDSVITTQKMNNALIEMQNKTSMDMLGELGKISSATGYVARCVEESNRP